MKLRTDFVLENVFYYVIRNYEQYEPKEAINQRERNFLNYIKEMIKVIYYDLQSVSKKVCFIDDNNIEAFLLNLSNEVFYDGITWERLISFIVLAGELCIDRKLTGGLMYLSLERLMKGKLQPWIDEYDSFQPKKEDFFKEG